MAMTKSSMELVEARGWSDVDTTICSKCVRDKALVEATKEYGGNEQCDYCDDVPGAGAAAAPFNVVLELVVDGMKLEYEDAIEGVGWDGSWVGAHVYDIWDLLWELEIAESERIHKDLLDAILQSEWCQRNPYAPTPTEALVWGWERFRKYVRRARRFTFLLGNSATAEGSGEIPMDAVPAAIAEAVEAGGLVKEMAEGTGWWRIRVHPHGETYTSATGIGTPPHKYAKDNRMSPKGIGAFYGASTPVGARQEVAGYACPEEEGSLGFSNTTVLLSVVDLRELPEVTSLFDAERRHLRPPIKFLRGFVEDLTQVTDPTDHQNLDYIPTQVIAETFRYVLAGSAGPVAGVLWKSTKDLSVTSCVLFISSDEVADAGSENPRTRLVLDPASVEKVVAPL